MTIHCVSRCLNPCQGSGKGGVKTARQHHGTSSSRGINGILVGRQVPRYYLHPWPYLGTYTPGALATHLLYLPKNLAQWQYYLDRQRQSTLSIVPYVPTMSSTSTKRRTYYSSATTGSQMMEAGTSPKTKRRTTPEEASRTICNQSRTNSSEKAETITSRRLS